MVKKTAVNKGTPAPAQAAPEAVSTGGTLFPPIGETAPTMTQAELVANLEKLTPDDMQMVEDFISKAEAEMAAERKATRRAETLANLSPRAQARLDMFLEAERNPMYKDRYVPYFVEFMAEQVMSSLMTTACREVFYDDGSDQYYSYMFQIAWAIQGALLDNDFVTEGCLDYLADLEGGDDE